MACLPFTSKYIEPAAQLLARTNQYLIKRNARLPERITCTSVTEGFIAGCLEKENITGMVLCEGSKVSGYLLGNYDENVFFGKHVMIPFGGIALADVQDVSGLFELYVAAGRKWIEDGVMNHYLVMPAIEAWLEMGFSLSFGKEQAYAGANMGDIRTAPDLPAGFTMRQVQAGDADRLSLCSDWIALHYNLAPVWAPAPESHLANLREGYAELATDPDTTTWLALEDDKIVSLIVIFPEEKSPTNLLGGEGVGHFAVAATYSDYRGKGIGRALFTHAMHHAASQGTNILVTDWRTTNPSAATYWPGFGFVPYAYRLVRRVNPRYKVYST